MRQRTFKVIGPTGTGTYTIEESNFRLLDALALAQGVPDGVEELFVIRQIPLADVVEEGYQPEGARRGRGQPEQDDADGGDGPAEDGSAADGGDDATVDPGELLESMAGGEDQQNGGDAEEPTLPGEDEGPSGAMANGDQSGGDQANGSTGALDAALEPDERRGAGRFINVNGEWVWVKSRDAAAARADGGPGAGADVEQGPTPSGLPRPEDLVTQRVIRVDADALLSGDARENIVIRPDDTIRIPDPQKGNVYVGGSIARPGTYSLPTEGNLTLKQLIISAGGLSAVAIPERVDLIRRLDGQREATVRLNLRSIFEGVQPDIFLKPNDTVNVGTNAFASHAAVIRNSFRFSYGFGFLLDRNFGRDVFGAPPRADQLQ
jgi:protein involved in polysaccharide export with SLBB domain